jgi:hypothetical protein
MTGDGAAIGNIVARDAQRQVRSGRLSLRAHADLPLRPEVIEQLAA